MSGTTGARALIPLYIASAVLTLGEGSFNLLVPPYMKSQHVAELVIGAAVSIYGSLRALCIDPTAPGRSSLSAACSPHLHSS